MHRICFLRSKFEAFAHRTVFCKRLFLTFKTCNQREVDDVFGIENITKEDVSGVYVRCVKPAAPVESVASWKEKEFVTSYGAIRLDSQNEVKVHGQFEEDFDADKFPENSETNMNFIDEQYLGDNVNETNANYNIDDEKYDSQVNETLSDYGKTCSGIQEHKLSEALEDANFIDKQYFGDRACETTANYSTNNEKHDSQINETLNDDGKTCSEVQDHKLSEALEDVNFIDKQYFLPESAFENDSNKTNAATREEENLENNDEDLKWLNSNSKTNESYEMAKFTFKATNEWRDLLKKSLESLDDNQKKNHTSVYSGVQFAKSSPLKNVDEIESELGSGVNEERENNELEIENDENEPLSASSEQNEEDIKNERRESPTTAFEYYKQLRRGIIEPESENLKERFKKFKVIGENIDYNKDNPDGFSLDSKGFRDFKEQRVDYTKFRTEEIVWHLKKNILFNDCEILAIDKPYGITCHGNKSTASAPLLQDLLPPLARLVNAEELYPVHRLDKEATGVLLLARTQKTAALLLSMFKERKIKKYYTAITRGVPDNTEGIIDIPMEESIINNKKRMALRPDVEKDFQRVVKPSSLAKRAVTHYRVKESQGNASLLEIFTETGVKHQIRCHLGFGLRTPILGDHKYSHLDRLAPQKLPSDMLLKLNVRQSKVRNIPLHLHCRLVIIPEIGRNGSSISISAHLPSFFKRNAKALKLK